MFIRRKRFGNHGLDTYLHGHRLRSLTHAGASVRFPKELAEGAGKGGAIVDRHYDSIALMAHYLADPSHLANYEWQPHGNRFQHDIRAGLVTRRDRENVKGGHHRVSIAITEPGHAAGDAQFVGDCTAAGFKLAGPNQSDT